MHDQKTLHGVSCFLTLVAPLLHFDCEAEVIVWLTCLVSNVSLSSLADVADVLQSHGSTSLAVLESGCQAMVALVSQDGKKQLVGDVDMGAGKWVCEAMRKWVSV